MERCASGWLHAIRQCAFSMGLILDTQSPSLSLLSITIDGLYAFTGEVSVRGGVAAMVPVNLTAIVLRSE